MGTFLTTYQFGIHGIDWVLLAILYLIAFILIRASKPRRYSR